MKRAHVFAIGAIALLACGGQPAKMEVAKGAEGLSFADHQQRALPVNVFDSDGKKIENPKLRFSSIAPRIAKVTAEGTVIPGADGRTRIVVRSGYIEHQISVNVRVHASIEIVPNVLFLNAGDVRPLQARVLDRQARTVENAVLTFSIADAHVAEVDERGALIGISPGKTTLTVRSAGASIELPVEVGATFEAAS